MTHGDLNQARAGTGMQAATPKPVDVGIYEPLYAPGQELIEPDFLPLRLTDNAHADWREFRILVDMYRQGVHRRHDFTGLFSPKFRIKAKITGREFIDFVRANAEADVCFVNPFPQMAYIYYNAWTNAEAFHPGILRLAQSLLDACHIGWSLSSVPRQGNSCLCYANFWVGTGAFWDQYIGEVLVPIADFLETNPLDEIARSVLIRTKHTDESPFLPFIIERLFSTLLSFRPELTSASLKLDPVELSLNSFQRTLVELSMLVTDRLEPRYLEAVFQHFSVLDKGYFDLYYSLYPHPHSGRPIAPEVT